MSLKKVKLADLKDKEVFDESGRKMRNRHLQPAKTPKTEDPLESMAHKLIEIGKQSDAMMAVVMKSMTEMLNTLSKMKNPIVNIHEPTVLKEWEYKSVRIDSKTVVTTARQIK